MDAGEGPGLFVAELDEVAVVYDNLVAFILGLFEELREGEELASLRTTVRRASVSYEGRIPTVFHRSLA
jgi:hypothetical protein